MVVPRKLKIIHYCDMITCIKWVPGGHGESINLAVIAQLFIPSFYSCPKEGGSTDSQLRPMSGVCIQGQAQESGSCIFLTVLISPHNRPMVSLVLHDDVLSRLAERFPFNLHCGKLLLSFI